MCCHFLLSVCMSIKVYHSSFRSKYQNLNSNWFWQQIKCFVLLKNSGKEQASRIAGSRYSNSALRNLSPLSSLSFSLIHTYKHTQMYEATNAFEAPEHLDERAHESERNSHSASQAVHPRSRSLY